MEASFPFLSEYDPLGESEGTLDPLGLEQIADRLAVCLVPAVRERMQRIRFLTAMAVGSYVTEDIEENTQYRDALPYLVWEWLVIESMVRSIEDEANSRGLHGRNVTRNALDKYGYLDYAGYLKTPRIFGFNGVYKRLAVHLGIVDIHLRPGRYAEKLVDAWAQGMGYSGIVEANSEIKRWRAAVGECLKLSPPCTKIGWKSENWKSLAFAFAPAMMKEKEKRCLREMLFASDERHLGALPAIWRLQTEFADGIYNEEDLHVRLEAVSPSLKNLLVAIRNYESFARSLQDAFDILIAEAALRDTRGYPVRDIASDSDFKQSTRELHLKYNAVFQKLIQVPDGIQLQCMFRQKFEAFSEPMSTEELSRCLCMHHKTVQKLKSALSKRAWFDDMGSDRICIRHAYRKPRVAIQPGRYVHFFRSWPIRRFFKDLA